MTISTVETIIIVVIVMELAVPLLILSYLRTLNRKNRDKS
jgi:hypothetical protein